MKVTRVVGFSVLGIAIVAAAVGVAPTVLAKVRQHRDGGRGFAFLAEAGSEIGASVRDAEQADVERAKLPSQAGAVVEDVRTESPAAQAGLKAGDLIIEFDGERVRSAAQLTRLVRETPTDRNVQTVIVRDGARLELTVTPKERRMRAWSEDFERPFARLERLPELNLDLDRHLGPTFGGRARLGITVEELTPQLAQYFGVKEGLLVSSVQTDDSPAAKAGMKAGDVITAVNQRPINERDDVIEALRDVDDGAEVTIGLVRDKKPMTLKTTLAAEPGRGRRAWMGVL